MPSTQYEESPNVLTQFQDESSVSESKSSTNSSSEKSDVGSAVSRYHWRNESCAVTLVRVLRMAKNVDIERL